MKMEKIKGVRGVVQCGFGAFLVPHFAMQFSQNHNSTEPHFCGHMCNTVYKMMFEWFGAGILFKFWAFLV